MTRVLLIADTERVQRIFQAMAEQGSLQLQTASTLPLGELELTASSPEFTFVQSRISGFSGDILLRHLDKMLPSGGKLVLLAGDSDDAAQAKRQGRTSLDLTMTDAFLERSVASLLAGIPLPEPPVQEPAAEQAPAQEPKGAQPQPTTKPSRPGAGNSEEPPPTDAPGTAAAKAAGTPGEAGAEPPAFVPFKLKELEADTCEPITSGPEEPEPELAGGYPPVPRAGGKTAASVFEEAMQRAEADMAPLDASMLEVEDRVEVRREGGGAFSADATPAAPRADESAVVGGGDYAGETVAEALRKAQQGKRRRPYLFVVPVLLLLCVPLVSYLAGKLSTPHEEIAAKAPPVKPAPAAPAKAPAAPKKGVEKLPELLEGTRLDPEYGRKNPGWVRYVGLRAEYKLFKENNLYRAIQVIPVAGGVISDDLFKRVLRQFGAAQSYRVESSAPKDGYVIEQCTAPGMVALTIYRHKESRKIKALVVYYR